MGLRHRFDISDRVEIGRVEIMRGNCILENLAFLLQWQLIKISDLHKICMVGRGSLKEHFCKTGFKISDVTQI